MKKDTMIKQIGTDLLNCLIQQGPAMCFETTYLLNLDEHLKYSLLLLF